MNTKNGIAFCAKFAPRFARIDIAHAARERRAEAK
jgi:hypothetical protein|tara:strand:- start:2222 stop:2326 length:105 start_codon:yes stop_codon:yes gene_type:complete